MSATSGTLEMVIIGYVATIALCALLLAIAAAALFAAFYFIRLVLDVLRRDSI